MCKKMLLVLVSLSLALTATLNAAPVSDGSLFTDDFSSGDLSKWKRVDGNAAYDSALGNPAGSLRVATGTSTEGFARPNMYWANSGQTEWVSEFDIKVSESTGDRFYLYNAFSPNFSNEIDIAIRVDNFDWVSGYPGGPVWDFHVYHANGSSGVTLRLDADDWHHFVVHSKADDTVDLYVNDDFIANYPARNAAEVLGELQLGDTSTGAQWGTVNWDNISVGEVVPEPLTLTILALGSALVARKRH